MKEEKQPKDLANKNTAFLKYPECLGDSKKITLTALFMTDEEYAIFLNTVLVDSNVEDDNQH